MPTPFPGMDPYLEEDGYWHQVHISLIVDIRRNLIQQLQPYYYVEIEQRTYLAVIPPQDTGIPDVMVVDAYHPYGNVTVTTPTLQFRPITVDLPMPTVEKVMRRYLQVRDTNSSEVITVIEILSPTNKIVGSGRDDYIKKRNKVLQSKTHLVEIDLLRVGPPMPMAIATQNDYRLVVSRSQNRPKADIYLFGVRDPIPDLPIPLRPHEPEPILPVNDILHNLYEQARYDLSLNYNRPPKPPLAKADAVWATQVIQPL